MVWYACYGSNIYYERFMKYIENCDDKMLKHLMDDWNMLKEVREFVEKCKKEGIR